MVTQIVLTLLFFKIPRFSHGIQFLTDPQYADAGALATLLLLFTFTMTRLGDVPKYAKLLPGIALFIYAILTFFWIRRSIKRKYTDSLKKNERDHLLEEQKKLEERCRKLEEENKRLSSIIHKDNKLMESMLLSVMVLMETVVPEEDQEKRNESCEEVLAHLKDFAGDRRRALDNYENSSMRLPETGLGRIDSLLAYMLSKAQAAGIRFEVTLDPEFSEQVTFRISTEDLETLLADLLENAIIATKPCEKKAILLSLHLVDGFPAIKVYDSGVPFPAEVKAVWGKQRLTTHADTGGSGIGMMSTYEICERTNAAFSIDEDPPGDLYTKCISVSF